MQPLSVALICRCVSTTSTERTFPNRLIDDQISVLFADFPKDVLRLCLEYGCARIWRQMKTVVYVRTLLNSLVYSRLCLSVSWMLVCVCVCKSDPLVFVCHLKRDDTDVNSCVSVSVSVCACSAIWGFNLGLAIRKAIHTKFNTVLSVDIHHIN